jgi:hypothetical protein
MHPFTAPLLALIALLATGVFLLTTGKDTAEAPALGIFFVFALPAGIAFGVAGLVFGMRRIFRRWRYGRRSGSRWALDAAAFSPTICRASGT